MFLLSPAKVNLRLVVEGRRADGYHLLSMINATTDWGDEIEVLRHAHPEWKIEVRADLDSECLAELEDPNQNLACRAALWATKRWGLNGGGVIRVKKNIPLGGGLGGGSSNAASVLRVLATENARALSELNTKTFQMDCLELGADVPYAVARGFAQVKGIGGEVKALNKFEHPIACALLLPKVSCPTPLVFAEFRKKYPEINYQQDKLADEYSDSAGELPLENLLKNDLQTLVCNYYPEVAAVFEALSSIPEIVTVLSGTGSTVLAVPRVGCGFQESTLARLKEAGEVAAASIVVTKLL